MVPASSTTPRERPARFSFARDEILDGIHEAWPHITEYIRDLDVSHSTLEKELDLEKTDNRRLQSKLDTLNERIQELEARLESLQPKPTTGDQSITVASTTDISSSDVGPHPLSSPGDRTYSRKRSRKLFENPSFQNRVMVPEKRPDYWSLYMWNAVKEWHTNPMSVPNVLRDNNEGYFLEEDIDVAAWISKVSADIPRSAFMEQMKVVFGSCDNFDTAFSGFDKNLLGADHQAKMWITDSATPLRIGNNIVKGSSTKSQATKPEKLPKGPDFLALVLEHCVLARTQIYGRIIPYMIRHEAKRPCSRTGSERAAYMHLALRPPAPHKGKRPVTGSLQSRLSVHEPTPVRTGEASRQRLDADLDNYNQVHEPVLPYEEEPPRSEPEFGDTAPPSVGANKALPDESHMDVDPELDDIYS
ncbi:hypothetical protein M422DRAFT_274762 [Sphaerobolus stellatus SS14]|uniref:Uncharacterized protein n=1 Tax=Sphaerobolus stellatus (strain SS14) TaxID=990650 RepID=A0A0C9U5U4_SPHS4|nr:hypothetical protein M422DRAFT_274762 [Sphaerobolus stellatus SS14]